MHDGEVMSLYNTVVFFLFFSKLGSGREFSRTHCQGEVESETKSASQNPFLIGFFSEIVVYL